MSPQSISRSSLLPMTAKNGKNTRSTPTGSRIHLPIAFFRTPTKSSLIPSLTPQPLPHRSKCLASRVICGGRSDELGLVHPGG